METTLQSGKRMIASFAAGALMLGVIPATFADYGDDLKAAFGFSNTTDATVTADDSGVEGATSTSANVSVQHDHDDDAAEDDDDGNNSSMSSTSSSSTANTSSSVSSSDNNDSADVSAHSHGTLNIGILGL